MEGEVELRDKGAVPAVRAGIEAKLRVGVAADTLKVVEMVAAA